MRRPLTALLTVSICALSSAAAYADCKDEVATALERQRQSSGFRMETKMITEDGKVDMTVDYVLPNRMRQIVTSTKDPVPVETVVVSPYAWTRRKGEPWALLNPQLTGQLISQMDETVGKDTGEVGEFECLGKKAVDGEQMLAYQGENDPPGPKNVRAKDKPKLPNRPVRVIYVDATTGLPMRSVFARADQLDKPIFEARYSYPADLKINSPQPTPAGQ